MEDKQKTILLSLALSGDEDHLLEYAVNFCERMHMKLELFHVVQDITPYASDTAYFPETMLPVSPEESLKKSALETMEKMAEGYDTSVIRAINVNVGWIEHCVSRYVERNGIDFVMLARGKDYHNFFNRMTSSLKSMSFSSSVPLIIVPKGYSKEISDLPKILVPDSLDSAHRGVVSVASSISSHLKEVQLYHIHVSEDFSYDIEQVPASKFEAVFEALSEGEDGQNFSEMISDYIRKKMISRWKSGGDEGEDQVDYRTLLLRGEPSIELKTLEERLSPDLLVIGSQSSSLWSQIFHRNKIPFEEQMDVGVPLLLVPEKYTKELEYKTAA